MIKSLTVTNFLGESVKIILDEEDPEHGLIIYDITGIGSPKANINTSSMATADGSLYNSSRAEERNIVLKLLLAFSPRIEDARHRTYQYFPVKKEVELLFETDNRELKIKGYVESNDPDIFTNREIVQISMICPDPFFYSLRGEATVFSGIVPLFEFIFSNESLNENLIEMGSIETQTEKTVHYSGDADVGVKITIHALGPVKNITIYNVRTRESMSIDTNKIEKFTGSKFDSGDDIIITTMRGNKNALLLRNGHYTNILNCLNRDCDWFRLEKGDNIFAYTAEEGSEDLYFMVENDIAYEGV